MAKKKFKVVQINYMAEPETLKKFKSKKKARAFVETNELVNAEDMYSHLAIEKIKKGS